MDGRTEIQHGQVEFERAAADDHLPEPQHSWASSHEASDGEQLDTLRARLSGIASAAVTEDCSSPRLVGTGVAQSWVPAGSLAGTHERGGDDIPGAFPQGLERLSQIIADAATREEPWLERIRAGLEAFLGFLDKEPDWAGLLSAEVPLDGLVVSEGAWRVHAALLEVLDAGRGTVIVGAELAPSTTLIAELLVTAVLSVIRSQLLRSDGQRLIGLAPSLMSFIVEPYLGRGAANADAAKHPSGAAQVPQEAKVVPIRAHPRILQVLRVITSTPGCGSREIEIAVSAKDTRGKDISDVLKRLRQRGLIENARVGRVPRECNAWLLTPYGRRVLSLITEVQYQSFRPPARPFPGSARTVHAAPAFLAVAAIGGPSCGLPGRGDGFSPCPPCLQSEIQPKE